jgi:hypothetical protein
VKSHLDQVIGDVDLSDFEIQIINKRVKYPTAYVYPNQEPPLIVIEANKPSLIRYALLDLLLHEKSHKDYIDYCAKREVVECVDHHESQVFRMIDEGNRTLLTELIEEEHD